MFTAHMKEVIHVTTDCLMLYSDFIHKCSTVQGYNTSELTYRAIELELLRTGLAVKCESKDNQVLFPPDRPPFSLNCSCLIGRSL